MFLFLNFSGKYILKTAFIIRYLYWYIQKRKQKKDFLYLWPAMRGLFLLIHCRYMDRRLMCCMKCRNPSEYVYTQYSLRYSEKKISYHLLTSLHPLKVSLSLTLSPLKSSVSLFLSLQFHRYRGIPTNKHSHSYRILPPLAFS